MKANVGIALVAGMFLTLLASAEPPSLSITPPGGTLTGGETNQLYTQALTASGGSGSYSWSIISQSDGLNLALTATTGASTSLSGTPTEIDTDAGLTITVQLTDTSTGFSLQQTYTIPVSQGPNLPPAGALPSGTTPYVLNEDGSLVAVASGTASSLVTSNSCECYPYDLARDASGNFIIAAGSQLTRYSSTGVSLSAIPAPVRTPFVSVAIDTNGNYIVAAPENAPSVRPHISQLTIGQLFRISPGSSGAPQVVATFPATFGGTLVRVDSSGNYILATDNTSDSDSPALSLFRITPPGSGGPVPDCSSLTNGCAAISINPANESNAPASTGGLTFDAQGNYIDVDWYNDIIYTITPSGSSTPLFSDPHGYLSDPLGIFLDSRSGDYLLVDDENDALYSLTPNGNTLSLIASGMLFEGGPDAVVVVDGPLPPTPPTPPPISINTSSLPNGYVGLPYGPVTLSATGGSGYYVWSVYSAPPGVGVSAAGVLSSTRVFAAAAAGYYPAVTVSVLDTTTGQAQTAQFAVTVFPAVSITTSSLPNGAVGATYGSVTVAATGGSGNYSWSVSGAPAGVTMTTAGVLSSSTALAASATGTYSVITTVTDTTTKLTASSTFSVTIFPALSVTTSVLPNGSVGRIYGPVTMMATGGSGKYSWSVSGAPPGITMTAAGVLTANSALTVSAVGSYPSVIVTVTDATTKFTATQTYTIAVSYAQLTLGGPANLNGFALGAGISASYPATGGDPPYTWSMPDGLPTGLVLNSSTGVLTGSITTPGNYSFEIQVSDSQPASASTSLNVRLFVLGISTTSLPSASLNIAYTQTLGVIGGTPPYSWSVTGGTLPAGLSLAASGVLTGTPTSTAAPPPAGITSSFTVSVTSGGVTVSAPLSLTITAQSLPLAIPSGDLAIPVTISGSPVSIPYSQTLQAINGKPPYSWSVIGSKLPTGLSLNGSGTVSGTPSLAGTFQFTGQVTDTAGATTASAFSVTIAPPALTITNGSPLPNGIVGSDYPPQVMTATGGTPPYSFQNTGALPGGLTFSSGGQLSGIPTAAGAFTFTLTATDSTLPTPMTTTASFQLAVEPAHPDLILSQASLAFSLSVGAAAPPSGASISVRSSVASTLLSYSINVTPAAPWLDVTSGATTPGAIAISIDPSALSLPAGSLRTSIAVTCIAPSPCAGNSQTINVTLNIATAPPQLNITTNLLSFSAQTSNPQPVSQTLGLQNIGGGIITVNSVTAADNFVTISGIPATLPAGPAIPVTVTVNSAGLAGRYYQSSILVNTSAGIASVPLSLLVSQDPSMTLSPSGTQFQMADGAAPGNPNGSFLVSVSGSSAVNWSAALLAPVSWLTLNTASGTSTSATPGSVSFSINSNAAALSPQAYYASIQVTSGSVVDSPQSFIVVLNVTTAATPVQPDPEPPGLVFISNGASTLPSQTVQVFAGSNTPVTYQASPDSSWLKVNPSSGSTLATSPGSSTVSVYLNGLAAGVYHGNVNYASSSAIVRSINVTLIVQPPSSSSSERPRAPCAPSQLIPTQTGLANNFAQPTSWPTPLAVLLLNDCGNPVSSAQVVATFSNGDPPLALGTSSAASGIYAGTWTPRNSSGQVTIAARAAATGFPSATAQIVGQVTPNAAPILNKNGTLNVFAPVVGAPVAPGTIVQIYGSNLASQATPASTIPLPNNLNQTSVLIGGIFAPLYYVSPGQINAQVPFELTAGNPYQVIVSANGALSTPNPIQLDTDAPGIAQFAAGEIIAQHLDGSLVLESSPAAPSEILQIYVAGMGLTNQNVPSGTASPSTNLAIPLDAPTLTLNGAPVTNILFAGLTPTLVGLYQMDFQVPANTPNGDLQLVLTQTSGLTNSAVLPVHN